MAQRFGVMSPNWKVILRDSVKTEDDPDYEREVGAFDIVKMEGTELRFERRQRAGGSEDWVVVDSSGHIRSDLDAGFTHDGHFYPVTGWVSYAKEPYKDDLMAGVRIYCRGKIAAQTGVFNRRAGFTGEHSIRSYLVGEIHADWLDEGEDLIQTDRRDLLWSHELGEAFEQWGQKVVLKIGVASRDPMKKKTWDTFRELTNIESRVREAFPTQDQQPIREHALELAKVVGQTMREDEARDPERAESIVQLSLTLAPHITLDRKLIEAASAEESPLAVISGILKTARIAELSSFGRIADDRVKVITRVEALKDDPETLEDAFQDLIEQAPWLIDPQWSPITANQSFSTLRREFQKYYKEQTGEDIELTSFALPAKRADFVLSAQDNVIQIVEIKKPKHHFEDKEMVRLDRYVELMRQFLADPANRPFTQLYNSFHVTLVCDGEKLTGVHKRAFEGLQHDGTLTYINWRSFLLATKRMHQDFLSEAERQQRDAAKGEMK